MPCLYAAPHRCLACVWVQVQELAEMLRGMGQRLSDGERSWEADKRGLEGQLNRTLHSLRESQASADQLRSVIVTQSSLAASCHASPESPPPGGRSCHISCTADGTEASALLVAGLSHGMSYFVPL